jgi:hypothetical protein
MLLERAKTSVVRAVGDLVALQAQVPRPPFVALFARIADFDRAALARAFAKRDLVRVTLMRATLHAVTAKDYPAFRAAIAPALERALAGVLRERMKGVDVPALVDEGRAIFDERPRSFDELRDILAKRHPKADVRAMAYAVRLLVPLVQVPTDATWAFPAAADFTTADAWLGAKAKAPARERAADALVLRYLAAFGPATAADAATFLGFTKLRESFERLRPELVTFTDDRKRELFDLPKAPRPGAGVPAPPRLLPEFDSLLLGHDDRERVIAKEHRPRVVTKNLLIKAVFLVDGFASGTWKLEQTKKTSTLVLEPFAPLAKRARAELEEEAERVARFAAAGAPFTLSFSK